MHRLLVRAGENEAQLETSCRTIAEFKSSLPHPIEIEAFGPQFFFSIMGQSTMVFLALSDVNQNVLETDEYELKFG